MADGKQNLLIISLNMLLNDEDNDDLDDDTSGGTSSDEGYVLLSLGNII